MRIRKSLNWYIYPPLILIILITVVTLSFFSVSVFRDVYKQQTISDLKTLSQLVGHQTIESYRSTNQWALPQFLNDLQRSNQLLFTIHGPDLKILGSIPTDLSTQSSHPEVEQAQQTGSGSSERFLAYAGGDVLFVATTVKSDKNLSVITSVGVPQAQINQAVKSFLWRSLVLALGLALLATLIVWFVTRRLLKNIEDIQGAAEQFAVGNLSFRATLPDQAELAKLAHSMNRMAHELDDRLRLVIKQRNQLDAVLSAMNESVIALDLDQKIIFMNSAAESLLACSVKTAKGRILSEIVRNTSLVDLVDTLLTSNEQIFKEFKFGNDESLTLQARGTVLYDASGKPVGGLIVLNDLTELRRLEVVRTDFVANVSHELRTPITSIKGFVETLLAGNVKPDDQERFLNIISKHCNRLVAIIDDLLDLAVLEQHDQPPTTTESVKISEVIDEAIDSCSANARAKNISISRSCREELRANLSATLLEQALVNYIDNAIKYSEENSTVRVEVTETDDELVFSVHDNGCGIAPEHQSRLFERFYRVDKARSRSAGGTGLGLSIVKHIAQSMGGYPSVKSSLGQGSTFQLHIPLTDLQGQL